MAEPEDMNAVEWRSIPEFPDYQASSDGRIRRVTPPLNGTKPTRPLPNELKLKRHYKKGYLFVGLWCRNKNKYVAKTVHRLVLFTFVGSPPTSKHEGCHSGGNQKNNCIENLRWGTRKENVADTIKHGTWARGARHHLSKLTPEIVRQLRSRPYERGFQKEMAKRLGVSQPTLSAAMSNKTWRHVK